MVIRIEAMTTVIISSIRVKPRSRVAAQWRPARLSWLCVMAFILPQLDPGLARAADVVRGLDLNRCSGPAVRGLEDEEVVRAAVAVGGVHLRGGAGRVTLVANGRGIEVIAGAGGGHEEIGHWAAGAYVERIRPAFVDVRRTHQGRIDRRQDRVEYDRGAHDDGIEDDLLVSRGREGRGRARKSDVPAEFGVGAAAAGAGRGSCPADGARGLDDTIARRGVDADRLQLKIAVCQRIGRGEA